MNVAGAVWAEVEREDVIKCRTEWVDTAVASKRMAVKQWVAAELARPAVSLKDEDFFDRRVRSPVLPAPVAKRRLVALPSTTITLRFASDDSLSSR